MRTVVLAGLTGLSLLVNSSSSLARAADSASGSSLIEEVTVSARRMSENLQDVPQTVDAIPADKVTDYQLQKFEDVEAVVPGLALSNGGDGYSNSASLRGVTFDPASRVSPTVEFYLNEALVDSNFLFQSLFDIGQIEVLRGPQGTLRGRASPSGAITVTTHKADLNALGGYISANATNLDGRNLQGALNVPLITDKLALRLAGVGDRSDYNGVKSVNSNEDPKSKTNALRATLAFEPADSLDASLMYQHLDKKLTSFNAVEGDGAPATANHAAGYNGPVLRAKDRRGITSGASHVHQKFDVAVLKVNWDLGEQSLNYIGSYSKWQTWAHNPMDDGNLLPGAEVYQDLDFYNQRTTHELRLSSNVPVLDRFDYTLGAFYARKKYVAHSPLPFAYLPGVYGSPLEQPDPYAFDSRYVLWGDPTLPSHNKETSFFANLTWHIDDATDLSVGGRYIHYRASSSVSGDTLPGLIALPSSGSCSDGSTYPGTCDTPIAPIKDVVSMTSPDVDEKPFVYNASLSHHFSDNLMAYVTVGSSWRAGVDTSAGVNNATNNAQLTDLVIVDPEKSRAYEVGFKSTFMDNRGRVNVAVYHQDFDGLIFQPPRIPYLSDNGVGTPTVETWQFTANANAVVDGAEVNAAFAITPSWSVAGAFSYADGHVDHDSVPCRDSNADGVPDNGDVTTASFPAGTVVAFCQSNMSVSTAPDWVANLQSEYDIQLAGGREVYLRGLYTYNPENRNRNAGYTVDSYGLLNLYVGLRDVDGAWDLSLYARNALDEGVTLSREQAQVQSDGGIESVFGPTGYYETGYTARREVGLSIRYAFGSR